jgi:small subunit ribosomal protein S8
MSRTDVISDAFAVIKTALQAKKEEAYIPYSRSLLEICDILKREGYLENFKEIDLENLKKIKVYLKYEGKRSVISQIKKISSGGRRVYVKKKGIRPVLQGYGVAIISTSSGLLTDKEARAKGLGGEVLGVIW